MGEIRIADVHLQVAINPFVDFDFTESELGVCAPGERQEGLLAGMLDEILEWSRALRVLRDPAASADSRPGPT